MRMDAGLFLAILLEYLFFIYYADTLFYRKLSDPATYFIISAGYFVHLFGCMYANTSFNIAAFFVINILCFMLCYHIKFKDSVFQSIVLVILSVSSELVIAFLPNMAINPDNTAEINATQSLILTFASKTLYLVGLFVVGKMFSKDKQKIGVPSPILVLIPVITIFILLLLFRMNVASKILSSICILMVVINIVLLLIDKRMVGKDLEIAELKEENAKENTILEEYLLLKEKYEKVNILHHDFKEHMQAINSLIGSDNIKAKQYISSIYEQESEAQFVEYTDSNMLNILLTKKKDECSKNNISLYIDPIQAHMSFINDVDIVSLFSNLINNAIEGCYNSEEKKIYLNIHTSNENFIVIKCENTSNTKPLVIYGKLRTHKNNKEFHGIGMHSIRKIIKKYNGSLKWSYDVENKIFATVIVLQNS